ncbi:MAG: metal-dependent hydrolase [Thermodesulfobacteriota bacterium]
MDTVTHGLTGWLIARALPEKWKGGHPKSVAAVLTLSAVIPDADNAASLLGSEAYLRIHRGLSHSAPGIVAVSLLLMFLFTRYGKLKDRRAVFLLVALGQLSHVLLDLLNSYGTQLLQPFSDARLSLDLLFVVDLVFSGIIIAGIALSRVNPARARAALAVLVAYVGLAALFHEGARDAVRDAAVRNGMTVVSAQALPALPFVGLPAPERLAFASPAMADFRVSADGDGNGSRRLEVPFPAGPFAWNGFIDDGGSFHRAVVAPLTGEVTWKQRVPKGADVPEVRALRGMADVETYLWFARFPSVQVASVPGRKEITFFDLRFDGMGGRSPFILRVTEVPGAQPSAHWGG